MTDVARPVLNAVSLCAGVGMLDEGVRAALDHLGVDLRTVAYGEWEAPAATQLVALMEAGLLDAAPVWCGDLRRIDAGRLRGCVDAVVAGFPCQDLSVAGRRAGLDGKRSGLFFSVLDFADDCDAWLLVLENVGGIATATASVVDEEEGALEERAASRVLGELADRGWNAEWLTLSASDVGASHGRERWFCLAWRQLDDSERGECDWAGVHARRRGERAGATGAARPGHAGDGHVDHAARHGWNGSHRQAGSGRGVCQAGEPMAHAERAERWSVCADRAGAEQRNDSGRRKANGGAGVADEALEHAGPELSGPAPRREQQRLLEAHAARGEGARDHARHAFGREPVADAAIHGRPEGRPESGWIEGRPDAAECSCAVADTAGYRQHEREHAGSVVRAAGAQPWDEPKLYSDGSVRSRADGQLADSGRARLPRGGGKRL